VYKTTKKDFAEFKKECWCWIEYFGLKAWEWDIRHEDPEMENARASYNLSFQPRYVCVRLNKSFLVIPDKNEIKACAFHEICHILLSGLSEMAGITFREAKVETEEHKIIQIFENTIFKEKRA